MEKVHKPLVRLENWRLRDCGDEAEQLTGNVYNHPRFVDGGFIYTTRIVSKHDDLIETLSTIYELGRPAPDSLGPTALRL